MLYLIQKRSECNNSQHSFYLTTTNLAPFTLKVGLHGVDNLSENNHKLITQATIKYINDTNSKASIHAILYVLFLPPPPQTSASVTA
jgi:hypothetical protein